MRRIDWVTFSESFRDRLAAVVNGDVWGQNLSRRIVLFTQHEVPADFLQELLFDQLRETLPDALNGILRGILYETFRDTLHEILCGTDRYLTCLPKRVIEGIGPVWESRVHLQELDRLIRLAKLRADARFIRDQMFERRLRFLSIRNTQEMLGFVDECSTRHAVEIKAYMIDQRWVKNNGKFQTHGSELVKIQRL